MVCHRKTKTTVLSRCKTSTMFVYDVHSKVIIKIATLCTNYGGSGIHINSNSYWIAMTLSIVCTTWTPFSGLNAYACAGEWNVAINRYDILRSWKNSFKWIFTSILLITWLQCNQYNEGLCEVLCVFSAVPHLVRSIL